jgi:hypothetical protein
MKPDSKPGGRGLAAATRWLAVAWLAFAVTPTLADDDDRTLRHFKTVLWPQAYRMQDVELLDRLLHPSFQLIDDQGRRSTKAGELEWLANNAWNPGSFEYRIERLDIYDGQWAVIDGRGVAEKYSYMSSNVLIKVNGDWQAVASHVSGYEER